MFAFLVGVVLAQAAPELEQPPADAPVAPQLVPVETEPQPLPTRPPEDPRKWTRVLLSGGAGVAGTGAAFGAMMIFSGIRAASTSSSGGSFDLVFGTVALGALLCAGFELAVHQIFGGKGEVGLAALAALGVMGLTGLAVGAAQLDPVAGAGLVAAIGAVPAAISVTAILEATTGLGRKSAW